MTSAASGPAESDREIVIFRAIDAPRRPVFEAYTAAEHVAHWWGLHGFHVTTHAFRFRPGGVWEFDMCGPVASRVPIGSDGRRSCRRSASSSCTAIAPTTRTRSCRP